MPFNVPIGVGSGFKSVVDVLSPPAEVPAGCPLSPEDAAKMVVEAIVEEDEGLMNRYLEGETIPPDELRKVAHDGIAAGHIVPVLYTFPERPEFPEKSLLFNQIIAQIALDYDLPLVNLYTALENLPDKGINLADPIHLSSPIDDNAGNFTPENLERGYTLRNLITLQALDGLWRGLTMDQAEATPEATADA